MSASFRSARPTAFLALLAALVGCGAPPQATRVVLVTIDTLRADRVGAYGSDARATPNLDALAGTGVMFEHAFSPVPLTLPAHSTILTGREPPSHGVRSNSGFLLAPDVPILSEALREKGLATAAFLGALVLDRHYGLDRGFDVYDDQMSPLRAAGRSGFAERRANEVVDQALAWLDQAPDRFFLWVHLYDPHANYNAPEAFLQLHPGDGYAAEIHFADSEVGRLIAAVRSRHRDGRTLFVVTSDHGESLGEHDESTHSYGLYDATQRVPMIFAGAGLPSGGTVSGIARLADVAPTILRVLGLPALAGVDGADLVPRMLGRQLSEVAYLETLDTQLGQGWSPLYGIRTETHKYIRAPRPELYDLVADPQELHDLAAEQPGLVAELDRAIDRFHAAGKPIQLQGLPDAATRQQLESLGYVVAGGIDVDTLGVVDGIDPKDGRRTLKYSDDARTLAGLRDFAGALRKLGQVLGGGPHIDVRRAQLARKSGLLEESLAYADSCAAMAPGWSDCVMHRALTLWEMGRADEAMQTMHRAAALDPSDSDPLAHLGGFHLVRGEIEQASEVLERAMESREGNVEVFWRLAAVRITQGRLDEADALLEKMPSDRLIEADVAAPVAASEIEAGLLDRARTRLTAARARAPGEQRLQMLWHELESRSRAVSQDG